MFLTRTTLGTSTAGAIMLVGWNVANTSSVAEHHWMSRQTAVAEAVARRPAIWLAKGTSLALQSSPPMGSFSHT